MHMIHKTTDKTESVLFDKRKTTLKHFREHLKDRTSYNEFLNYLLNLEEGLRE